MKTYNRREETETVAARQMEVNQKTTLATVRFMRNTSFRN
jgi:hypothetical protein